MFVVLRIVRPMIKNTFRENSISNPRPRIFQEVLGQPANPYQDFKPHSTMKLHRHGDLIMAPLPFFRYSASSKKFSWRYFEVIITTLLVLGLFKIVESPTVCGLFQDMLVQTGSRGIKSKIPTRSKFNKGTRALKRYRSILEEYKLVLGWNNN